MKIFPDASLYERNASGRRTLFYATLAALLIRLVVIAFVYQGFLDPGRDHWEFGYEAGKVARSIVTGHGFGNIYYGPESGPTAMLAPVFPYLLAGAMALFGIYTKAAAIAILSLNSFFSALTCVPIFFLAKKSFGLREARWATWTWAFFPYAVFFSAASMWNHALTALFVAVLFLIALHLQDSTRLWEWAGFGFLWGLGALVNPVLLGTLPFLGAWICYRLRRKQRSWRAPAAVAALAVLVTISPWLLRNYRVFHHPIMLNGFPLVFTVSNVGNTLHWWNPTGDPPGNAAEMTEYVRVGEQAYMSEKWDQMFAFIKSHPGIVAWRSVRRFVYMWTGYWSLNREYLREERFDPPNIFLCASITLLGTLGLRRAFQTAPDIALPCLLVWLVFPAVYYVTSSTMAYREHVDPLIVILGSHAVVSWLRPRRRTIGQHPVQEESLSAVETCPEP